MTRWILTSSLFIAAASGLAAQETGKLSEQPIVVLRSQGWTAQAMSDYVREINEDLNIIDGDIVNGILYSESTQETLRETTTAHQSPVSGMLVYMVQGLIPSTEQIAYSEVVDHAEFTKLVQARKKQSGDLATIEGSDDRYKTTMTNSWREDVTDRENADVDLSAVEPPENRVTVRIGVDSTPGPIVQAQRIDDGTLIEENGRKYREHSMTNVSYFRYHDGLMFESQYSDLWNTALPSGDSLRAGGNSGMNGEVTFYPDRIPMGFRHLAWNALNGAASAELQQRDAEKDEDYVLRRAPSDAGLALVQAAIFDTQQVSGWMRFATDDEPIRGELKVEARKNSKLGKSLGEFASANSRFAPILNDGAAATFHVAVNLTDDWKTVGEAWSSFYGREVVAGGEYDTNDPEVAAGLKEIITSLGSIARHGTLEGMIKTGWTKESGAVIYGGLQIDDNPNLLNAVLTILKQGSTDDEVYELVNNGDLQMLQISIPADAMPEGIHLSRLYITQSNSCLWFAIGGENASEILTQSIARCQESGGRARTPLLTAIVDLQRWLAYPQDDPTGLTRLPELGSQIMADVFNELAPGLDGGSEGSFVDSDLMLRAVSKGGTQDLSVFIDADESGLLLKGTVGSAIARAFAAQALSVFFNTMNASELSPESNDAETAPAETP